MRSGLVSIPELVLDECCLDCADDVQAFMANESDEFHLCFWCARRIKSLIVSDTRVRQAFVAGHELLRTAL